MDIKEIDIEDRMGLPYPTGSRYEGSTDLSDESLGPPVELPSGFGILTTPDGQRFEGTFKDGLADGNLVWTNARGAKYMGEWKDGKRHGQGVLLLGTDSDESFVGMFAQGSRVLGTYQTSQATYSGVFAGPPGGEYAEDIIPKLEEQVANVALEPEKSTEGASEESSDQADESVLDESLKGDAKVTATCAVPAPQSSLTWNDGTHYVGEWVRGWRHGRGTCSWEDGSVYAGQWIRGVPNGPGRFTFPDGSWYQGEHVDGVRHGSGRMRYPSGAVYEGAFDAGEKHGVGIWKSREDEGAADMFIGEFYLGKAHGSGTFSWAPRGGGGACVYQGEFEDGLRHGAGTYTVYAPQAHAAPAEATATVAAAAAAESESPAVPAVYEGEWIRGKKHGVGKLLLPDGSNYDGEFKFDKMWGTGRWQSKHKDVYEGHFKQGERDGFGRYVAAHGEDYEGDWVNGAPHGKGIYSRPDGTVYDGDFSAGNRTGEAKIVYVNGDIYDGCVDGGKPYGFGTMLYADGQTTYKGEWKMGMRHGEGVLIRVLGGETEVIEAVWNRNQRVKQDLD